MADFRLGASQGRFLVLGDRRPCGEAKTDDRPVRWLDGQSLHGSRRSKPSLPNGALSNSTFNKGGLFGAIHEQAHLQLPNILC